MTKQLAAVRGAAPAADLWLTWLMVGALGALFALVGAIIAWPPTKLALAQQLSASSAVALIGAAAVTIERIIEAFWTLVGLAMSSWWPMERIGQQVNEEIARANTALEAYRARAAGFLISLDGALEAARGELDEARAALAQLTGAPGATAGDLGQAQQRVAQARSEVQALLTAQSRKSDIDAVIQRIAPPEAGAHDVPSAQLAALRITGGIDALRTFLPQLQAHADVAQQAVSALTGVLGTFKDNPARRLISIYLGALIGLAAAWAFQLDLFQATLQPDSAASWIGVVGTGLVMGLGANPTHEVIRLLEEFKKSRKALNRDDPGEGDGARG